MDNITVHIANFHSVWSHIEIILENKSTEPSNYYRINRWTEPEKLFCSKAESFIKQANSVYSFDIQADSEEIIQSWNDYWHSTEKEAGILGKNCAVAAQWFLTKFAGIPEPSLANVSLNHFAFGIMWPSFIPCPIALPGRIMSNAKFYIKAKEHPEHAARYTRLFLYTSMALAALAFTGSMLGLAIALTLLGGGIIGALAITLCVIGATTSAYGFFKNYNILSAKKIAEEPTKSEQFPFIPAGLPG